MYFVSGNKEKILLETGKSSDNIRVSENGLESGVNRVLLKSSNSTIQNVSDRFDPLGKSVDFDVLFLGQRQRSCRLFRCFHDTGKFWYYEYETGLLYFGPLLLRYLVLCYA